MEQSIFERIKHINLQQKSLSDTGAKALRCPLCGGVLTQGEASEKTDEDRGKEFLFKAIGVVLILTGIGIPFGIFLLIYGGLQTPSRVMKSECGSCSFTTAEMIEAGHFDSNRVTMIVILILVTIIVAIFGFYLISLATT